MTAGTPGPFLTTDVNQVSPSFVSEEVVNGSKMGGTKITCEAGGGCPACTENRKVTGNGVSTRGGGGSTIWISTAMVCVLPGPVITIVPVSFDPLNAAGLTEIVRVAGVLA